MATAAAARSTLRVGLIPGDGIGKEVIPVRVEAFSLSNCRLTMTRRMLDRLHSVRSRLSAQIFRNSSSMT